MTETFEKHLVVPKFTEDNQTLQFEHEGHQSVFAAKGEDGHLVVRVRVERDATVRREGHHIISKHYVTLTEAMLGCNLTIPTVAGPKSLQIDHIKNSGYQYTLSGEGVNG